MQKPIVMPAEAEMLVAHGHQRITIEDAYELDEIAWKLDEMIGGAPGLSAEWRRSESDILEAFASG